MSRKKRNTKPNAKRKPRKRHSLAPRGTWQGEFVFQTEGRHFNLRDVFDRVNEKYFRNRLRDYTIKWGPRRKKKPMSMIVFGCIQEEDRVIRINPLLDQAFVPWWYVEYVVFHEMLHAFVPDRKDAAGRRVIHHDGFLARERKFRHFRAATNWERSNLGRFLR
jgi:hypothetical protein